MGNNGTLVNRHGGRKDTGPCLLFFSLLLSFSKRKGCGGRLPILLESGGKWAKGKKGREKKGKLGKGKACTHIYPIRDSDSDSGKGPAWLMSSTCYRRRPGSRASRSRTSDEESHDVSAPVSFVGVFFPTVPCAQDEKRP